MTRFDQIIMANNGSSPFGRADNGKDLLDRSKVRILLCDNDVKSSNEVLGLLCKCSYQVTAVRTARQVIDALNAEASEIDIILAEIDLPIAKGLKMLKYIMRDKAFRHIPIIMMSCQDEVSVVVKCLRLGAADYLVKPLRTNELLNLWTHMWRRRRMLGLAEKNILNCDSDLIASDPSDANTNSTTLFSDDTDEKSRRTTLPETSVSNYPGHESNISASMDPSPCNLSEFYPKEPVPSDQSGGISSCPKKSKLKVGECSAFFTYVKSSGVANNPTRFGRVDENVAPSEHLSTKEKPSASHKQSGDAERHNGKEAQENYYHGNGFWNSENYHKVSTLGRSSNSPVPLEYLQAWNSSQEQLSTVCRHSSNENQVDASCVPSLTPLPLYLPGMMNHVMIPSSGQLYQEKLHDTPKHGSPAMLPQFNTLPQCPHAPMISPFPYYPVNMNLQQGQMPPPHLWPTAPSSSLPEAKSVRLERREVALMKFKQKRKDRCFNKRIRYVNRKQLAERRPRVRGQFVRQVNDVDAYLNGQAIEYFEYDEEEDEDEEEDALEF